MASWSFKKISTHFMEGAGILSEFWMIGLLHEIGRKTKYYNGNVNQPHVGYFVTLIFCLFYSARIFGNLISLKFAEIRKFVLITYLMAIPAIVGTVMAGWHSSIYWIVGFRCLVGFCTSFAPIMCMIRSDLSKAQLMSNYNAVKQGQMEKKHVGRVTEPSLTLVETIEFLCAYGSMALASFFYTRN